MAFNSQAFGHCPVTAECKVEDASCFAGLLVVVWESCCLFGPLNAVGAWDCSAQPWEWDIEGIPSTTFLPAVMLAVLLGGLWACSSKHMLCIDVSAWRCGNPRGLGHHANPAGVWFLEAAWLQETICHIMFAFFSQMLCNAPFWLEGENFPLLLTYLCQPGCPGLPKLLSLDLPLVAGN